MLNFAISIYAVGALTTKVVTTSISSQLAQQMLAYMLQSKLCMACALYAQV